MDLALLVGFAAARQPFLALLRFMCAPERVLAGRDKEFRTSLDLRARARAGVRV